MTIRRNLVFLSLGLLALSFGLTPDRGGFRTGGYMADGTMAKPQGLYVTAYSAGPVTAITTVDVGGGYNSVSYSAVGASSSVTFSFNTL